MESNFTVNMNEYLPLRDVVFNTLRQAILRGELKPGERLMEVQLANKLGVSRTPIREAIRKLELEGLVTMIPNKGAYVTGISQKDVYDIYRIRSVLEGLCARWATEHITEEQIEGLEEIILLSEFHLERSGEQAGQVTELDGKFHKVLYEASNSRILEHVLSDFHKYVQAARSRSVAKKDRARKFHYGNTEIFYEAMKNKDADLAEELANQHIMNVMDNLHMKRRTARWQKSK